MRNFQKPFKATTAFYCGLSALIYSATAQAQTVPEKKQESLVIDEIVVTARKREERLSEVPLSVQVFSGDAIEVRRIENVDGLIGRVPNLSLSSNALSPGKDFLNMVIRGVGAQSAGTPAVGTFVDGAYVPGLSFDIGFMDVERIEILRGPQGTLFGRNTQGGALNIVLKRPDETTRGKVAFTIDEFETARGQGAISGQISDNLFGGIAIDISRSDGYLKNPVIADAAGANGKVVSVSANDDSSLSGRMALRYIPSEDLEINLAIDGSLRKGLDGFPGVPRGTKSFIVRTDFQIDARYENYGGALNIDYSFGEIDLTSITAYRKVTTSLPFDFDGSPERLNNIHDLRSEQKILSQELRLAGDAGETMNWLIGAYGFSEDSLTDRSYQLPDIDVFPNGIFINAQIQELERKGIAVFGDISWNPVDNLEISAGLRFSHESVDSEVTLDFELPGIIAIVDAGTDSLSESSLSPSASIRYNWTPNLTTYLRYARGFKAGGFPLAPASASTNISFETEVSDNYEFGIKGAYFDNALIFDFSAFQIDITDQQLSTIVFLNGDPNLPVASVGNAGKSRSKGFEANITAQPFKGFELVANIGTTDATYSEYVDTVGTDRSGESFPFVPKWTVQISGNYVVPLGEHSDLGFYASYRYVDSIFSGSGVDVDLQFMVESYDIIDLRVSLIRDNWRLDAFIDNVTNDFIETRVFNAFFFAGPRPFSIVLPPRRAGVRFMYSF